MTGTIAAHIGDELETGLEPGVEAALQSIRPVPRISIQAFCETEGVYKPIERAKNDRRMGRAQVKLNMGGLAAAIEYYSSAPTPNLVIVESRLPPSELFSALAGLAEVCDPSSKVVIIGHHNDVTLYRELIRSGISEYLVAPISIADVIGVVSQIFVDPQAEPLGRIVAFVGVKGGVGSSTVAHNMAWTMSALFKAETVLLDADLAFGTANMDFDQDPAQGMAEAVFSSERFDETMLDRLLVKCSEHLSMLAAPAVLDRTYDLPSDAIMPLLEVAQRSTPLIILDLPHIWSDWVKRTLVTADEVVIVASPDLANLRNAKNMLDQLTALRPNDKKPWLVLNQVGVPKRPEISVKEFATPLGVTPLAAIPFDPQLFGNAANNGQMIGEMDAANPVAAQFNEMAHVLTGRAEVKAPKRSGLQAMLAKLKRGK
ncbi:MAG: CpaE family protein [Rhizobiaceae bacterium]|jgi:pilus assembly protein CpaE|nr:CpaE family protein [Rhizobiaceae bacterium]